VAVTLHITDAEIGRAFGQQYRNVICSGGYDRFVDWFYNTTGYRIIGFQGEYDDINSWAITLPSEADLVQFKLRWL
jgi:hypothetical protein